MFHALVLHTTIFPKKSWQHILRKIEKNYCPLGNELSWYRLQFRDTRKILFLSEILLQMFGTEKCPHMTNMKVKVTSELMFLLVIHDYH